MKKALIIIDLQNDYFCGGKMELVNPEKALKNTNKLIKFAKENTYKIYVIQHIATEESPFFVPNTEGIKIHKNLDVKDATIIEKNYPNSFKDTILNKTLKQENITELIICGAMTHMCIDSSVRAGFDLGYKILVAQDACATKELEFKGKTIKAEDVHGSFIAALGSVFCEIKDTNQITK